jgi:hypothetical protein
MTTTRLVAAAVVAAGVVVFPLRLRYRPGMLPRPPPLLLVARAPIPPARQRCSGGRIDSRYGAVGRSGEQGNLGGNAYCGGNAYFARKIKRGPAKLGEDYGSIQKH